MRMALGEAEKALLAGEVPVGAVIVAGGDVLATAHNSTIALNDPSAHAEILAIRRAGARLKITGFRGRRSTLPWSPVSCARRLSSRQG